MKKYFFIIILLAFAAWITGCSKDSSLVPNQKAYYKPASTVEKDIGSIKGSLFPVPSYAVINVKGNSGFGISLKAMSDGSFIVEGLDPGSYNLVITYVVNNAGYSYTTEYDAGDFQVLGGEVVSAGVIHLPWTY